MLNPSWDASQLLNIWNLKKSHLSGPEMCLNMASFHCFLKKWRFKYNQGNKWQNIPISGFPGGWDVKIGHEFCFNQKNLILNSTELINMVN
jgi:hypothetical protein